MKLICAGITDVGRSREHNEDDFYLSDGDEALCIVADGMGGHRSGEVASAMAIKAIVEYYRETMPEKVNGYEGERAGEGEDARDLDELRIHEALQMANRSVFQAAESDEAFEGMGTTLVSAYFTEDGVYLAHIGDSRAYLFREGSLEQVTHDHSLANEYVRMGILAKEDVEFFPYKNVITRACGLTDEVEIDVGFHAMKPGDMFVFCSDGLSDMVPDRDLVNLLDKDEDLEVLCQRLVDQANENGGSDNITIILARVVEED